MQLSDAISRLRRLGLPLGPLDATVTLYEETGRLHGEVGCEHAYGLPQATEVNLAAVVADDSPDEQIAELLCPCVYLGVAEETRQWTNRATAVAVAVGHGAGWELRPGDSWPQLGRLEMALRVLTGPEPSAVFGTVPQAVHAAADRAAGAVEVLRGQLDRASEDTVLLSFAAMSLPTELPHVIANVHTRFGPNIPLVTERNMDKLVTAWVAPLHEAHSLDSPWQPCRAALGRWVNEHIPRLWVGGIVDELAEQLRRETVKVASDPGPQTHLLLTGCTNVQPLPRPQTRLMYALCARYGILAEHDRRVLVTVPKLVADAARALLPRSIRVQVAPAAAGDNAQVARAALGLLEPEGPTGLPATGNFADLATVLDVARDVCAPVRV